MCPEPHLVCAITDGESGRLADFSQWSISGARVWHMGGDRYALGRRFLPLLTVVTAACATSQVDVDTRGTLPASPRSVVLLPIENMSGAPLAGERAEAILLTLLRQRLDDLRHYQPQSETGLPVPDGRQRYLRALTRAREAGLELGVTGTVVEWRYRPGLDDEPAVSISLRIVDVPSGRILWSGSGARGSGGTVGALAQVLLRDLSQAMPLGKP